MHLLVSGLLDENEYQHQNMFLHNASLPPVVFGYKLRPAAEDGIHSARAPSMGWFLEYKSSERQKDSHIVVAV